MPESKREIKEKIAEMVRVLSAAEILTLTSGHISYRVPGTNEVFIPRHIHHEGKTLSQITADDIVTIRPPWWARTIGITSGCRTL